MRARCAPRLVSWRLSVCNRTFAFPQRVNSALVACPTFRGYASSPQKTRPLSGGTSSIEDVYQKKTPIEHVLLRPDSYVGSTARTSQFSWVTAQEGWSDSMERCELSYVPALYKIFDEILVNAADNKQRDPTAMTSIRVDIDVASGTITIFNDGRGIPVHVHKKEKLYVPELVFGHLLTGSNFDDNERKVTGGRNGYGAKLCNIYSKEFEVVTVDCRRGLKYKQVWRNNMGDTEGPQVEPLSPEEFLRGDYTQVKFAPDLGRFGMKSLEGEDIVKLMERRVWDVAACNEDLKVELNGVTLPNSFDVYREALFDGGAYHSGGEDAETSVCGYVSSRLNKRWFIGVGISKTGQFEQVSFVNSISTPRGGTHVNNIAEQVVQHALRKINFKCTDLNVNAGHVRNHLAILVSCLIENPAFDSQTKETLSTRTRDFGSSCKLSKALLNEILTETQLVERVVDWAHLKQQSELAHRTSAVSNQGPRGRIRGIPKLDDANAAGGEESSLCTLIVTEGDSAKALAVAGLSVLGRDHFGVYPLKGKLLNVRDASHAQLMENKELRELETILGLSHESSYDEGGGELDGTSNLRYGRVMLMTDQDHDGSHIKGLFINYIHTFWPSLLQQGFLQEFVTPIVKVWPKTGKRGDKGRAKSFYTVADFERWAKKQVKSSTMESSRVGESEEVLGKSWQVKYYKGLGTSTTTEAKEYFSNIASHRINLTYSGPQDDTLIDMAFRKSKADERREWLATQYSEDLGIDHTKEEISFEEFINKELIHFSNANNIRAIPSMVDGLKPSQRKVLYGCFKRNLVNEIKVAQLAGYISEHAAYHHGETSLHGTIINMAQDFVGSNNLPLLVPCGQFGTRIHGGQDAASARYIFTYLHPVARKIFPADDDALLDRANEDGDLVQPVRYVPIIPMILVNGCTGLGTGWSTFVPPYNPLDIISNVRRAITGESMADMVPWYRGFTGNITKTGPHSFRTSGKMSRTADRTIRITELPVRTWTHTYKEFLEKAVETPRPSIRDFRELHTHDTVDFEVSFTPKQMALAESYGLEKKLKLHGSISLNNMHLFDANNRIKKYDSPHDIIADFCGVRMDLYRKRKGALITQLEREVHLLDSQTRFCELVIGNKLELFNRRKEDISRNLLELNFSGEGELKELGRALRPASFDYLLRMPLSSLTRENMDQLLARCSSKKTELIALRKRSERDMFTSELDELEGVVAALYKKKR